MTTIINTPPAGESSDSGLGVLLGVILAIVLIALFFIYALPAIRDNKNTAPQSSNINVDVKLPATEQTAP